MNIQMAKRAVGVVFGLLAYASFSQAQSAGLPVDINVLKMVNLPGESPRLTVITRGVVGDLRVAVKEGDKTIASKAFGKMGQGGNRVMTWSSVPGIHTYQIDVSGRTADGKTTVSSEAVVTVMRPLQVVVEEGQADVQERRVFFRTNNPAAHVEFIAYGGSDRTLYETDRTLGDKPGGALLEVTWPKLDEPIKRIAMRVFDVSDSWAAVELLPFSVEIPHLDVVFETNKWDIRESEVDKLDQAHTRLIEAIREHGSKIKARVYIIGQTDTVGKDQDNLVLSRHRANAIARYFKDKGGITLPIMACGVGEAYLAVKTGDNVDEIRNRRAQYILAAQSPIACNWTLVSSDHP
jgi:outer membrane protein OmpA-like peptidoglycan-associated protein